MAVHELDGGEVGEGALADGLGLLLEVGGQGGVGPLAAAAWNGGEFS